LQVVPRLRRFPVEGWVDPADAFVALYGEAPTAVWLDAGAGAEGGRSYLASGDVVATSSVDEGRLHIRTAAGDGERVLPGTMLDFLRSDLDGRERLEAAHPEPSFALGWVGWLGYESGASAWDVPVDRSPSPDAAMAFVDRAVAVDHERRTIELIALDTGGGPESEERLMEWVATARASLSAAAGAAASYADDHAHQFVGAGAGTARWRHSGAEYLDLIRSCQESIRQGDAYQLCLTNEATASVDRDALALHLRLRTASPAHHGGFLRLGGTALISSSPERFLSVTAAGRVQTKPIKGTRPRGTSLVRDLELRAELEASDKERAENVMIVDLMRNDLGRVCEVGSVAVSHLLAVESYPQVHQLVSTVEGRLRPGLSAADAVAACFPAGSMTGAPKLSAMRILNRLEGGARGVYSGCFGYFGLDGAADLAMVIRSVVVRPGTVSIGAGGGITALSVPEEELDEVAVKAKALLAAAGLTVGGNG
jgi:para-aminobenzoate synthetase component 1